MPTRVLIALLVTVAAAFAAVAYALSTDCRDDELLFGDYRLGPS